MRGDRKKQEDREKGEGENVVADDLRVIDVRGYKLKRIPQLIWRECIKKVWEVDPLTCPNCTGEMRIISFIYKRKVIKKILTHLQLYNEGRNQRAPLVIEVEHTETVQIVPFVDGWPEYEEPVFEC